MVSSIKAPSIRNISGVIVLFGLVLLCFLWIGLYIKVASEREIELTSAIKETEMHVRMFEEHTVRTIKGLDQIALFLKYQVEKEGQGIDILRYIREERFTGQPFNQLGVFNENGDLMASSQVPFSTTNITDREHFTVHRDVDSGKAFVSKPIFARTFNKWSIQLSRRINKADGTFGGVAVISVDPNYFADFYKLVIMGSRSAIALVGRDGIVRIRQSGNQVALGLDYRQNVLMKNAAVSDAGNFISQSMADGTRRIYSYISLREYPLIVVAGEAESDIFQSLNQRIVGYYWVCGAMSLVIVLFVVHLIFTFTKRRKVELALLASEQALRESEERYRTMVEKANDLVYTLTPDGTFTYISPNFTEIMKYDASEVIGHSIAKIVYPDDQSGALAFVERIVAAGENQGGIEYRLQHKDGSWQWHTSNLSSLCDEDWKVISVIGIDHNIDERKRMEDEVRRSQIRYRALVNLSFEAVALIDLETQELVEINRSFTELFGYSLPEDSPLYAQQCAMLDPSDMNQRALAMPKDEVVVPEIAVFRRKNRTLVTVERASTLIHLDGRDYLIGSARVLSEERHRQIDLARDAEVARRVQQELLPELKESTSVTVRTFYHPSNFVSGDTYYLEWRNAGKQLRGFLVDISGHGLTTALQTASISVLLREGASNQLSLFEQIRQINEGAEKYFAAGSYATMLGFELDLSGKTLQYVGAGITQFCANGQKISTPGMFVGMWADAEFIEGTIPVSVGDTFHFLTDGFTDALAKPENAGFWSAGGKDFDADVAALERLAASGTLRDDATGVCVKIKELL